MDPSYQNHAMATTEELLQQLIDLQKEEMRRTRNYRLTKFLMGTLPMLIILILSVWGSIALFHGLSDALQNNPSLFNISEMSGF